MLLLDTLEKEPINMSVMHTQHPTANPATLEITF